MIVIGILDKLHQRLVYYCINGMIGEIVHRNRMALATILT